MSTLADTLDQLVSPKIDKSDKMEEEDSSMAQCIVLNPGKVCKRQIGGTYAKLVIQPYDKETLEQNGGLTSSEDKEEKTEEEEILLSHSLHTRARIDIIRL